MSRPSPATKRTVTVLNFLAAHPDRGFTLSEIARGVSLNKATAHALLAALVESGYLLRHPSEKTYRLGPSLIPVGMAAVRSRSAMVDQARPVMDALSLETGLQCTIGAEESGEIVVLEATAPSSVVDSLKPGQRVPLVPPIGVIHRAWSSTEQIDEWLQALPAGERGRRDFYRRVLAETRRRGYAVGAHSDALIRLTEALEAVERARAIGEEQMRVLVGTLAEEISRGEYLIDEIEDDAEYALRHIAAPVFGPASEVVFVLSVLGFRGAVPGEELRAVASKLQLAAAQVTGFVHGQLPPATTQWPGIASTTIEAVGSQA